ncbi:hypothetical protein M3Y98_00149500 [Aphelenchoides besseyi]|nr:hypothetical protein M3Y98_00149500 [Aphelenchoides besseyi]KAI6199786.1 hypothetical protein M3Y96_00663900 [Aphelenchoides besseyi]
MTLMASSKSTNATGYENHYINQRDFPLSIKTCIQCVLFIFALLMIGYYVQQSHPLQITSRHKFTDFINSLPDVIVSQSARTVNNRELFCWVDVEESVLSNENYSAIIAVHQTWLKDAQGQFFVQTATSRLRKLAYRTVYRNFDQIEKNKFWRLFYGFSYASKAVGDFHWYLKAQLETFVFIPNVLNRLRRLKHDKPYVIFSKGTTNATSDVVILSRGAVRLLHLDDQRCLYHENAIEGFKRCFTNLGAEVFDEHRLRLHVMDGRWLDALSDNEPSISYNLFALTNLRPREMFLAKTLTTQRSIEKPSSITSNMQTT